MFASFPRPCLPQSPFLFPFVGWPVRLPEVLSSLVSPHVCPLDGSSASARSCQPFSPTVSPHGCLCCGGLASSCLPLSPHIWGDNGRQGETRGDKGRQDFGKADTPSNTGTHMWGDNGRQWAHHPTQAHMRGDNGTQAETREARPWKADTPSNTGTHVGRQWETREDKGRQRRHTCRETMGEKGRQRETTWRRRAHHPTQAHTHGETTQDHMWGDNGEQGEARGDKT